MKIKGLTFILLFFSIFFLVGCNTDNKENSNITTEHEVDDDDDDDFQFIPPSPLQIAQILEKAGLEYIPDLTNPSSSADDYSDKFSQSLNFGVYSCDLAYCVLNDKFDESSEYLKAIKNLGGKIGLETVFQSEDMINRFESNIGNQDSIIQLLIYVQENTDSYIEDNGMNDLQVIYFIGAWAEGMYLGVKTLDTTDNRKLGVLLSEEMTIAEILLGGIQHIKKKSDETNDLEELISNIIDTYNNFESILNAGEEKDFMDIQLTNSELELISGKIIDLRHTLVK